MTVQAMPCFIQGGTHPAENARNLIAAMFGVPVAAHTAGVAVVTAGGGHGVVGFGDLAVTQNGTPNMSVNVAAGRAIIRSGGSSSLLAGSYAFLNDATLNVAISASDPTNPRIDLVVAQVRDTNYGEAASDARLTVVAGTPAASPAVPSLSSYPNCVVLAQIAVAAASTTVITANITDKRTRANALGGILPCTTANRPTGASLFPGQTIFDLTLGQHMVDIPGNGTWTAVGASKVLQVVNTQTGAVATGTTVMPWDDTIPQNTEGDQYMTLAITPQSASSNLLIEVRIMLANNAGANNLNAALFVDSTANALAAVNQTSPANGYVQELTIRHYVASGSTAARTYKVRAGGASAGTTTFNGSGGARLFGGVASSSITITEIAA